MKKNYTKKFKSKAIALLFICGLATNISGQCVSTINNPSGTINVSPIIQTIVSGAMNPNNYAVINIATAGEYQVNTSFGTSLNISDNSNVSLASGNNPLNVSFPTAGLYRVHVCSSNSGGSRIVAISPKNRGFNFDGVDDIIQVGTSLTNAIGTSSVLTAEAWIRPTSTVSSGGSIVSNHNLNTSFCLRRSGNTYNAFVGFGAQGVTSAVNTVTLNVWQHVAMVFNGTSLSMYINGNLAGTTTFAPYTLPANSVGNATVQIGNNGFNEAFEGDIDEVRVWKRAVCQGEIQQNMNGVIATTGNQLLANYHFEQGVIGGNNTSVTSLFDLSGNAYNGTVMNAALTGATSNWAASAAYPANGASPLVDVAPAYTPPTISISGASSICNGASTTFTASGSVSTYNWLSGPTTATNSVSPTTTSTYSVFGTNSLGCQSNTATITLTVNALPTVSVTSGAICSGQSFTMVPSGANTYTYSNGSSVVTPTINASYNVTGTDANGCVSSNTAVSTVTVNALPTVSVTSGAICTGQSYTMVPSGANTYTYSSGSSVVTPTMNASYNVTGTDANGCVSSNAAVSTVTVNALPTVSVTSGAICSGKSFTMVPTGANTYTYSSGSAVVTPSATASYSVTGTDANGCISSSAAVSSVTVNALPMVMATTNNTLLCTGNSATLTATGATSYTWNTTATTAVIAVSPTTTVTYTVNGTGANGCSNAATVTQSVSTCAGIATLSNDAANKLYPNPNNGLFTIELTSLSKVTVTNALGQIVIAETFEAGNHNLDIINQSNGVYFVKVIENNKQQIIKVIKQ